MEELREITRDIEKSGYKFEFVSENGYIEARNFLSRMHIGFIRDDENRIIFINDYALEGTSTNESLSILNELRNYT